MKNELLLSTILLMNPIENVTASEIKAVRATLAQAMIQLAEVQFVSPKPKSGQFWRYDKELKKSFEFVTDYKVRVSFIVSNSVINNEYRLNNRPGNGEMDYEVLVEKIATGSGEVLQQDDSVFFAKRLGANKFRIYDCNSTSNCWDESEEVVFYADVLIFNTSKGRILKVIKNKQHSFARDIFESKVLFENRHSNE